MTVALNARQLVDKLWSYCHVLRHDGVSTIDYVDQLILLFFPRWQTRARIDGSTRNASATIIGVELVDGTTRLTQRNLLLHGIGPPTVPSASP